MSIIDLFAAIGYLILDICALLSVTGSALILLFSFFVRSHKKIPEQLWTWSALGLIFGMLFGGSMLWKREYPATSGLLGINFYIVGLLFLLSFVLLLVSFGVRRSRRK